MPVTIVDIAKKLNLSHTTVSRSLNNRRNCSIPEETRLRVIETAKIMGYHRNRVAHAMVTGKTHNLGLFAEGMQERSGPHFARMLLAVEKKARELGYRVVVYGELDSMLIDGLVDGAILLADPNTTGALDAAGISHIFVWGACVSMPNRVSWDDVDGVYKAITHLYSLGHRNMVALMAEAPQEHIPAKITGLRTAVHDTGMECFECWGTRHPDQFENAYLLTKEVVENDKEMTTIFARNDIVALGAMKALKEAGRAIPQDISVIGYNDTEHARYADPALTSVHTPIAEAGEIAVEYLVKALRGQAGSFEGALLPTTITVRDSCAPLTERWIH